MLPCFDNINQILISDYFGELFPFFFFFFAVKYVVCVSQSFLSTISPLIYSALANDF